MSAFLNKVDNVYSEDNTVVTMSNPVSSGMLGFSEEFITKNLAQLLTEQYQDPMEAAIRETISNALDATASAGSDAPVVISLSGLNCNLSVTDHGTGMSREEVENHFLFYGSSTKREDFNSIGAKGIGAKAPLAYSDEFTVATVKDGRKTIITVRKDDGYGYDIVADHDTMEHNGTTIVFRVNNTDISAVEGILSSYRQIDVDNRLDISYSDMKPATFFDHFTQVDDFVYHTEEDGTQIKARMWVNSDYMGNCNLPWGMFSHNKKNTDGLFLFGGWAYNVSNGNSSMERRNYMDTYNDSVHTRFIVELLPGVLNFPSSRDSIMRNDRFEKITDAVHSRYLESIAKSYVMSAVEAAEDTGKPYEVISRLYNSQVIDLAMNSDLMNATEKEQVRNLFGRFDNSRLFSVIKSTPGGYRENNGSREIDPKKESSDFFVKDNSVQVNTLKDFREVMSQENGQSSFLKIIDRADGNNGSNSLYGNTFGKVHRNSQNNLVFEDPNLYLSRNGHIVVFVTGVTKDNYSRLMNNRSAMIGYLRRENRVKDDNGVFSDFGGIISIIAVSDDTVDPQMVGFFKGLDHTTTVLNMKLQDVKFNRRQKTKGLSSKPEAVGSIPISYYGVTVSSGDPRKENFQMPGVHIENNTYDELKMPASTINDDFDVICVFNSSSTNSVTIKFTIESIVFYDFLKSMGNNETKKIAFVPASAVKGDSVKAFDVSKVHVLTNRTGVSTPMIVKDFLENNFKDTKRDYNSYVEDLSFYYMKDASDRNYVMDFMSRLDSNTLGNIGVVMAIHDFHLKGYLEIGEDSCYKVIDAMRDSISSFALWDNETIVSIVHKMSDDLMEKYAKFIKKLACNTFDDLKDSVSGDDHAMYNLARAVNALKDSAKNAVKREIMDSHLAALGYTRTA